MVKGPAGVERRVALVAAARKGRVEVGACVYFDVVKE